VHPGGRSRGLAGHETIVVS